MWLPPGGSEAARPNPWLPPGGSAAVTWLPPGGSEAVTWLPPGGGSAKRWRSARPERDEGTLLWELSQYRHVRPLVFYSLREGGLGETSPAGFPLSPLPLIIPSPLPLWAGRSSRAEGWLLLHQTAKFSRMFVATLCFAPTRSTVRQVSRGERPRTSYLFHSCSCLHAAKNLHPSGVQVSVLVDTLHFAPAK